MKIDFLKKCTLHKKMKFPLRKSSVNVTKSTGNNVFGHITEKILHRKLNFFGSSTIIKFPYITLFLI